MDHDTVPTEQLVAFVLGEVDAPERNELASRIAASADLAAQVQEIRELLALLETDDSVAPGPALVGRVAAMFGRQAPAGPSLAERLAGAVRVIAELVYDSRIQPAVAGFRGQGPGAGRPYQLTYRSELGTVELGIARRGRTYEVRGQLDRAARSASAPIVLVHGGTPREAARATADERGVFSFEAEPGSYDLLIDADRRIMIVQGISLGDH